MMYNHEQYLFYNRNFDSNLILFHDPGAKPLDHKQFNIKVEI